MRETDQDVSAEQAPVSEEVFAETLRAKVREITALIKSTEEGRDFSKTPISVEEVSELLAADMDLEMLPPAIKKDEFFWRGDSPQARSLNAHLLVLRYCTDNEF